MYISFRRKVYRYCRKLLHIASIGLREVSPTHISAKTVPVQLGITKPTFDLAEGICECLSWAKAGKWKEICRRILLHWKKVVPLHHCKRRKRLCETFREGKKGKGLIAQLV